MADVIALHGRHRAYLRAVRDGRAEMTCSIHPDLYVDGLECCDQVSAHQLTEAELIKPTRAGRPGQRVPASLTEEGRAALTSYSGQFVPVRPPVHNGSVANSSRS